MKLSLTTGRSPILRSCIPATGIALPMPSRDAFAQRADRMQQLIADRTLPFWFDYAFRGSRCGFRVGYDPTRRAACHPSTLCVTQARLTWAFSRAHRLGYSSVARNYLVAAEHGRKCLAECFLDRSSGGYFWRASIDGPIDSAKLLYGQSFVIYALVEYAIASSNDESLDDALALFRLLNRPTQATSGVAPAIREICARDFDALPAAETRQYLGIAAPGYRCANSSLHWMESLTELYRATGDSEVKAALADSLALNEAAFYPEQLDAGVSYHPTDAQTPPWPEPAVTSHGHNVEFGWLMIEAQHVLGHSLDWTRLELIIAYTMRHGFDHHRGGISNAGRPGMQGYDSGKSWWPQAEMIAALAYSMAGQQEEFAHAAEFGLLLDWYFGPQMHQSTGTPYFEVDAAGLPLVSTLSADWQAAYHDLRARWIFIDAARAQAEMQRGAAAGTAH